MIVCSKDILRMTRGGCGDVLLDVRYLDCVVVVCIE